MKATKFTVTITVEVLSMDSVRSIASDAIRLIDDEAPNGKLAMDDGDTVKWETKSEDVEF